MMTRISKKTSEKSEQAGGISLDFHIEVMPSGRGYRILVSGVRSVKSFTFQCILIRLVRRTIRIVGDKLEISSLEDGVVQISGLVKEIELLYDKF